MKAHRIERSEAKAFIASATAVREKEKAEFKKKSQRTFMKTNMAAMAKVVGTLPARMEGSFLRPADAQVLAKIILAKE